MCFLVLSPHSSPEVVLEPHPGSTRDIQDRRASKTSSRMVDEVGLAVPRGVRRDCERRSEASLGASERTLQVVAALYDFELVGGLPDQ